MAVKENIDSEKAVHAFFNADSSGKAYKVRVFVLDQWNSDTELPVSLADAVTID